MNKYHITHQLLKRQQIKESGDKDVEEIEFLYSIYVPNRYLILNNQKSIKILYNHLYKITIDDDLNLNIHLFLSSIFIKYVTTWYNKLNTNNHEFTRESYHCVVQLCTDLICRIEKLDVLNMIDDVCHIVNDHIDDFKNGKYMRKYQEIHRVNRINDISQEWLKNKHIIFENESLYLQILTKNILHESIPQLSNSKITHDLICLIFSDLVLKNMISKLSSPQFIFENIMSVITRKENQENLPSPKCNTKSTSTFNFLNSSLFDLLDNILSISERKPILCNIMKCIRLIIQMNQNLTHSVNKYASDYLHDKISVFNSSKIGDIINNLRTNLFYNENPQVKQPITIDDILSEINVEKFKYLYYENETDTQFKQGFERILEIFQNEQHNKLLIVNLVDCLIYKLYPNL